jgi:hypothetical protein
LAIGMGSSSLVLADEPAARRVALRVRPSIAPALSPLSSFLNQLNLTPRTNDLPSRIDRGSRIDPWGPIPYGR